MLNCPQSPHYIRQSARVKQVPIQVMGLTVIAHIEAQNLKTALKELL
jgi:hypothetical protein